MSLMKRWLRIIVAIACAQSVPLRKKHRQECLCHAIPAATCTFVGEVNNLFSRACFLGFLAITAVLFAGVLSAQEVAPPQSLAGSDLARLERLFQNPPDDSRIMMRWWWFGPAVTKPELEREMQAMKAAGIGGFEVQPVYPLALDDDDPATGIRNLPFLSDDFIDALKFVSEKAHDLGLRMDLTLGSGWPYGGPQVPIHHAAGQLRLQRAKVDNPLTRVALPSLGPGEKLLAVFLARFQGQAIVPESVYQVSVSEEGTVELPGNLSGPNEVLFFISSRTGMMVKRPAVGAEGYVVDHYDAAAIREYQTHVGDRLMRAFDAHPPYAVFCDSLEVFQSDWTGDFLDEFQKRRGYDIKPYLPALMFEMGSGTKTEALRHDWGQTLTELFNERFVVPMREWAKQQGTLFRMQGYGMPPAEISSSALADLPEGEGPQWKVVRASRWASSASHLYGRPVTSSETWTWIHSPVFRATPLDLKAEADLHFLQGINQLVGHGWPYTPEKVEYPGWRFYAAGALNNQNPWWIVMPDLSRYLQRVSALLRQGQPVNDVALYLPNSDAWAHFSAGRVHLIETLRDHVGTDLMPQVLEAGYNLDFFDDDALRQVGRVEKDVLQLGPGKYRVVILPGVERMPLETLMKLAEFARSGGVLIATRRLPSLAPGFLATDSEHEQVRDLAHGLFEGQSAPAQFIADEKQLGRRLSELLRPDVSFAAPAPDIGFVHRKTQNAEIYFVANTGNTPVNMDSTFRSRGKTAEWWNPVSGQISQANMLATTAQGTTVHVSLAPYESTVLVISGRVLPPSTSRGPQAIPQPIDLSQGWQVTFGQNGRPKTLEHLESWTNHLETRYFSGAATYEKEVMVPKAMIQRGLAVRLDFGEGRPIPPQNLRNGMQAWLDAPVREGAVVYVNDERAGAVWCPPYSLNVAPFLRAGTNHVKIIAGNLAVNYMAGHSLPDYRLLNLRYGVRFEPQDMDKIEPVPSGLFGPIRLVPVAENKSIRF